MSSLFLLPVQQKDKPQSKNLKFVVRELRPISSLGPHMLIWGPLKSPYGATCVVKTLLLDHQQIVLDESCSG